MSAAPKIAPDELEERRSSSPVAVARRSRPPSDKAERIVEAMRLSVARRGTSASTFDQVAREAGVSRGLLHYYFGSKEHLLVEAARRDFELRMEVLERQLVAATTADDFIHLMAKHLEERVSEDPDLMTLIFELFTLSRRNDDIAVEYSELMRQSREKVAGMLDDRTARGGPSPGGRAGVGRRSPVRARRRPGAAHAARARTRLHGDDERGHRLRARAAGRLTTRSPPARSRTRRVVVPGGV